MKPSKICSLLLFALLLLGPALSFGYSCSFCHHERFNCLDYMCSKEYGSLRSISNLQPTQIDTMIKDLERILNSYHYIEPYSPGKFDCIDTTVIATRVLQDNWYNPATIGRFALKGGRGVTHLWLAVPDGSGRFAFIETTSFADGRNTLGAVVDAKNACDYTSGYILTCPMNTLKDLGLTDERFLSDIHKYVSNVT